MEYTSKEWKIIEEIKNLRDSPSHDIHHSLKVACYSSKLLEEYGGNREIIIPAALLHDLGRHKKLSDYEHIKESVNQAEEILNRCGYSREEIEDIKRLIELHDSPEDHDSKILYDADKLSGFGALGIARVFLHCGEMSESLEEGIYMLEVKMKKRIENLNFEYSKKIAREKNKIVEIFLEKLKEDYEGRDCL
jgi:uncharacterized protein